MALKHVKKKIKEKKKRNIERLTLEKTLEII